MKKEVSYKITLFNFIFTIAIVSYHFRGNDPFKINFLDGFDKKIVNVYFAFFNSMGYVAMTFFFLLSSFLFYINLKSYKDVLGKIRKRLKTLFIPYLIWNLIVIIYKIIKGEKVMFSLKSLLFMFFINPINGPTWYMMALILLMFMSFIIIKLRNKKLLSLVIVVAFIVFLLFRELRIIRPFFQFNNWWWYENMIKYLPAYIIGAYLGLNYSNLIIEKSYNRREFNIIGVILIICGFIFATKISFFTIKVISYILIIIGSWLIISLKNCCGKYTAFMKSSFFIYVTHGQILIPEINNLYGIAFKNIEISGSMFIILKVIGIIIMVLFCIILTKVLKKIANNNLLYYSTGGRI